MKLRELLKNVNEEIQTDKIETAKGLVKESVLQIEELKKALAKAESNLENLLEKDVDNFNVDVNW